ncbi:putative Cation efflux family [Trypanosoma vivax]|uniref:Putative cation transporter n=1 Tax=Trypanosoma vivax (strain Y486) TaxID=1055687 RepID=G0U4X9_TRYVY|nr:putative cation transporter [Trypanosoma vivax]KAH8611407.1 putative Cation efflux family [Trypanosoma vivax]CCC52494.1 putative cation transporter [Trypanosoma vivax Y486]
MRRRLPAPFALAARHMLGSHGDTQRGCNKNYVRSIHMHSHGCGHNHSHTLEGFDPGSSLRQCQLVTLVGGLMNVVISGAKISIGSSGGSVALVADGFHALVDILADVVSYITIVLSTRVFPRCRFPFGIGRVETAGAVIVSAMLFLGGLGLMFKSLQGCWKELSRLSVSFRMAFSHKSSRQEEPHHATPSTHYSHSEGAHGHSHFQITQTDAEGRVMVVWAMVLVSAVSIVGKEILFHWTKRVGEQAGSRVVVANAYHHRADAWSGLLALVGAMGHCVGLPGLDGLAGLLVSGSICHMGYKVMHASVLEFFDFQRGCEVGTVRRALQDYGKMPLVNPVLTRHGQSYTLHVTLLAEAKDSAEALATATRELTLLAQKSVRVTDTFISICVCARNDESSLRAALETVESFHDLKPIHCRWETKCLFVPATLPEECLKDVQAVASFFGMQLVIGKENPGAMRERGHEIQR